MALRSCAVARQVKLRGPRSLPLRTSPSPPRVPPPASGPSRFCPVLRPPRALSLHHPSTSPSRPSLPEKASIIPPLRAPVGLLHLAKLGGIGEDDDDVEQDGHSAGDVGGEHRYRVDLCEEIEQSQTSADQRCGASAEEDKDGYKHFLR